MPSQLSFSPALISAIARQHYGLQTTEVTPLPGEVDLNFRIHTTDHQTRLFKIAHAGCRPETLDFQNQLMQRLAGAQVTPAAQHVVPSVTGEWVINITDPHTGDVRYARLLSWVDGEPLALIAPHTEELMEHIGTVLGKTSQALAGFDHPAAHRYSKWDVAQWEWIQPYIANCFEGHRLALIQNALEEWHQLSAPLLPSLRKSTTYADANDYNILVSGPPEARYVPGIIDFGDALYSYTVGDPAIAAAYCAMHQPDPLATIAALLRGFHAHFPLQETEIAALWGLIKARLLISVTASALNRSAHPENDYLQISDAPAWALLEKLNSISPALALAHFRHACGLEPAPSRTEWNAWAATGPDIHPVVPAALEGPETFWLDLSVGSLTLGNHADIADAQRLHRRIETEFEERRWSGLPAVAAIGRYNEVRPFYTTDAYLTEGNNGPRWRTVHIGLDIFMPPGTPVMAPLDGIVHSFQDNANDRDYGPAILLEHRVSDTLTFYTLYGHLSRTDLPPLQIGQKIAAGTAFCTIGPMPENGNWSPHLHFQVMLDTLGNYGDFPGVAYPEQREVWTSLCPDPWLLLTGSPSPAPAQRSAGEIAGFRQKHLGRNLSISYHKPLYIQRGWQQYLFDDTGRRYLDTVNNVAHVGHEHPRVVRAGQAQMAVLNTNTRYLHQNIIDFSAALLRTFPAPLDTVFFVNSGSEANELALRLAQTATGAKDTVVVEIGYHGNTQGCVEVSSYKFDRKGGSGAAPHIHVTPLPDTYRGLYREDDPLAGAHYAAHIQEAVARMQEAGRRPAAFLCESVISCGGQIPLPDGYLAAAAGHIRQAGGLLIADEVQTGCGRQGTHFWAFQAHGVVPDIVTIGKPIGNGHPLGAVVTTSAIAEAFANGMEYFNTFGGNPVSCAIGLEVLRVIQEEGLQENALHSGDYLIKGLRELATRYPIIGDVRGSGLFLGFELTDDPATRTPATGQAACLVNRMRELGILMSTDGPFNNVIKIKPPIVFSQKDGDFLLSTLERVMKEDAMRIG